MGGKTPLRPERYTKEVKIRLTPGAYEKLVKSCEGETVKMGTVDKPKTPSAKAREIIEEKLGLDRKL